MYVEPNLPLVQVYTKFVYENTKCGNYQYRPIDI